MRELSLTILDIAQNSLRAGATGIGIRLVQSGTCGLQSLHLCDNGAGMGKAQLEKVWDPFFTSRETRTVGLGLPFLRMAAQQAGGSVYISSVPGVGTSLCATFILGHVNLMPLGNMGASIAALLQGGGKTRLEFTFSKNSHSFTCLLHYSKNCLLYHSKSTAHGTGAAGIYKFAYPILPADAVFLQKHINAQVNGVLHTSR